MAAPSFVQANAGAASTTGNIIPNGLSGTAGNILILHVVVDGAANTYPGTWTGSNFEALDGTDGQLTLIGTYNIGGTSASHRLYIGRFLGGLAQPQMVSSSGTTDVFVRMYEFTGVNTGTTLAAVLEQEGSVNGTSNTIAGVDITTGGADRLCLQFVAVNDDNALDAFTGNSGGTWAEAVAEYADAAGTDAALGLQIATLASAGTITGGTDTMSASDGWGVVGFALLPVAGGGGTAHSLTPSDTLTLSDDLASKAMGVRRSDTTTLQEAVARAWAASRTAADTITLTDAAGKKVTLPRADTLTLTDAAGKAVALPRADTITLSDATSRVWAATRALADTVTLTDARSKAIGLPRADTLTLSDVITPVILLLLQFNDTITLSDSPAKAVGKPRADTITLSDQLTRAWAALRSRADTVTLTDAVGKSIKQTLADTIATSDALGKKDTISRADALSLADAIARASGLSRADTLTLTDALARGVTIPRADTIVLSDAQGKAFGMLRADSITLSDFADVVLQGDTGNQTRNLADTIVLGDDLILALNGQFITGDGSRLRTILLNRFGIY